MVDTDATPAPSVREEAKREVRADYEMSARLGKGRDKVILGDGGADVLTVPRIKPTEGSSHGNSGTKATPVLRINSISCDRASALDTSTRTELDAKLHDPALLRLLAHLPQGTVLELSVDAKGQVTHATFSKVFPDSAKALARIRAWKLAAWNAQDTGVIRIALEMGT
jgi:hypothetical protein